MGVGVEAYVGLGGIVAAVSADEERDDELHAAAIATHADPAASLILMAYWLALIVIGTTVLPQ